jgi:hypothetical protein
MRARASSQCFQTGKHAVAVIRKGDYAYSSRRRFDRRRIGDRYPNGDMLARLAASNQYHGGGEKPQRRTGIA